MNVPGSILLDRSAFDAERAWLRRLGITAEPPLRERPFDPPRGQYSFIVPASWHQSSRVSPGMLAVDSLKADLLILELILRDGYAGWEPAARRGWDWARLFQAWHAELDAASETSVAVDAAFEPWSNVMAFQLDNHTGPIVNAHQRPWSARTVWLERGPSWTAVFNVEGARCPLNDSATTLTTREAWLLDSPAAAPRRVTSLGFHAMGAAIDTVETAAGWLVPHVIDDGRADISAESVSAVARTAADAVAWRPLSHDVWYLRLPTLSTAVADTLRTLEADLVFAAAAPAVWIIDLRGNHGGDGGSALALLRRVTKREDLALLMPAMVAEKRSYAVDALRWGFLQSRFADRETPLVPSMAGIVQSELAQLQRRREKDPSAKLVRLSSARRKPRWSSSSVAGPRIVVLIDSGTRSDGEGIAALLRRLPGSVTIGSHTCGAAEFGRPGRVVLPHTRIPFAVATSLTGLYQEGRSFDGLGLAPDLLLDPSVVRADSDWIDLARRAISLGFP